MARKSLADGLDINEPKGKGGSGGGSGGGSMDAQKKKVLLASACLVVAGLLIAWQFGAFDSLTRPPNQPQPVTTEQTQQLQERQKQHELPPEDPRRPIEAGA